MKLWFSLFLISLSFFFACKKSDPAGTPSTPVAKLDTVMDIDGNVYRTVKIGNQIWMAQNLRVTRYNNGDTIKNIKDDPTWANTYQQNLGGWCHYGNSSFLDTIYGKLYNWYAVSDSRGIAPKGWHVATAEDFKTLLDSVGGADSAGVHLKEASLFWQQPNIATNKSQFSARPGGTRTGIGPFENSNRLAHFWSMSPYNHQYSLFLILYHYAPGANVNIADLRMGMSIRCVKNK